MGNLGQLAAALGGELGDRHPDRLALGDRVEAEAGIADRLVDRPGEGAVPDLDQKHPRLGRRNGADLVQRHRRAIGLDGDRLEQADRCPAGAQAGKFVLEDFDSAMHPALQLLEIDGGGLCHDMNSLSRPSPGPRRSINP
jgi:hypothetical protein